MTEFLFSCFHSGFTDIMLKKILLNEYVWVFLFCFAVVQGPAFSLMDNYDANANVDCQTYLGIARLELNQSPVRRYRPVVPVLAGSINYVAGPVLRKLQPGSFPGDFSLGFSFLLVNSFFVSMWGVLIYRFCKSYGASIVAALCGLLVMLSCRWTPYIAGTPLVDSFYCCITALALLGIKERNERMIVWAILLGPFAKESFIFIAPVIFFFSHVHKGRQIAYFALSGALVFGFRYLYDHVAGFPPSSGLEADIYHLQYVRENVGKLFSFHGAYDILSNFGLWLLLPVAAWWLGPAYRALIRQNASWYLLCYMLSILVHMLLSGYLERMFYLSMPLICMFTSLAFTALEKQYFSPEK